MYNDMIGTFGSPDDRYIVELEKRSTDFKNPYSTDYDTVRFGNPTGTVKFEEVTSDRNILLTHFNNHGYGSWPHTKITERFKKHIALFRASLDFWEVFSKEQIMDKSEIYFRCLSEGHKFTEWVKKCRSTCFRAKTSETDTDIEEEYYSSRYDGYNSMIHERYLIHWDDTKDIDDVKYAFIPPQEDRTQEFEKLLDNFWDDFRLDEVDFSDDFDMIGALKNTKMYDPHTKNTSLMRDFWNSDIDIRSPYFAKRTVVPTYPGSTRDTGVGDPSTILKVKQLNFLARKISERVPYSANADEKTANGRLKRVLRRDMFLHLDFKKFGLTFPRNLMNAMIRKIGASGHIDVSHLLINEFYVEIEGVTYRTHRGTMLGWLDSINSLCVCVILHSLKKDLNFDFITFNDDVEISKRGREYSSTLELLRASVLTVIDFFDIPISINKTFGSRCSVFLERYAYYDIYNIDMYKEQLTVKAYAQSCVSKEPWKAKLYFAAANQWTKSTYATDRCIDTCPVEFRKEENSLPLWSGGWFITRKNKLDYKLVDSDNLGIRLGYELDKFKQPRYTVPPKKVASNDVIYRTVNERAYKSEPPDCYLHNNSIEVEPIHEINHEIDYIRHSIETKSAIYDGKDVNFPIEVLRIVTATIEGTCPIT
jgi:hypothetical protein